MIDSAAVNSVKHLQVWNLSSACELEAVRLALKILFTLAVKATQLRNQSMEKVEKEMNEEASKVLFQSIWLYAILASSWRGEQQHGKSRSRLYGPPQSFCGSLGNPRAQRHHLRP